MAATEGQVKKPLTLALSWRERGLTALMQDLAQDLQASEIGKYSPIGSLSLRERVGVRALLAERQFPHLRQQGVQLVTARWRQLKVK